jgi:hypothetical protein
LDCYEAEFGKIIEEDVKGVPLEHLLNCIQGVEIISHGPNKFLQFAKKNSLDDIIGIILFPN